MNVSINKNELVAFLKCSSFVFAALMLCAALAFLYAVNSVGFIDFILYLGTDNGLSSVGTLFKEAAFTSAIGTLTIALAFLTQFFPFLEINSLK